MPDLNSIILTLFRGVQLTPNHVMMIVIIICIAYIVVRNPELLHGFFAKKNKDRITVGCNTCIKIMNSLSEVYRTKIDIARNSVVREQMNYAEFILETMFVKFCSSFKEQLVKKRVDGSVDIVAENGQYNIYRNLLQLGFFEIKSWVRIRIRENHFADFNDDKFKGYCNEVVNKIFNDARDWLNKNWPSELIIDSAEDFTYIENHCKNEMMAHGVSIFVRAREITLDTRNVIDKLHIAWDEDLARTIKELKEEPHE